MKATSKIINKGEHTFILKTDADGLKTLYRRDDTTNLMEQFIANIKSKDKKEINQIVKRLIETAIEQPAKIIVPRVEFKDAKFGKIPGITDAEF